MCDQLRAKILDLRIHILMYIYLHTSIYKINIYIYESLEGRIGTRKLREQTKNLQLDIKIKDKAEIVKKDSIAAYISMEDYTI